MPAKKPKPSKYSVRVGRSNAGLGLFAKEDIPKDAYVIEYFGPLLSDDEADLKGGKFLFEIDKNVVIDGSSRENKARYINHSCRSNCLTEIDGKRLFVYAKKNIKAGEEITFNYGRSYFNDFIKPFGCRCPLCAKSKKA